MSFGTGTLRRAILSGIAHFFEGRSKRTVFARASSGSDVTPYPAPGCTKAVVRLATKDGVVVIGEGVDIDFILMAMDPVVNQVANIPFCPEMEQACIPQPETIAAAVRERCR